jgi:nucleotide-binding universal stress UspA family protein
MLLFSIRELLLREGKEALSRVESLAKDMGVAFESAVAEGNPGGEIISFAEKGGMDIIILGAVGRTGLDKFLLGSVAEKVVRNSRIPVLTIPRERT